MKAIVIVGVCDVMIIWIIPTYILSGICLLRVSNNGACAVALGLQCIHHSDVNDVDLAFLLLTWALFCIFLVVSLLNLGTSLATLLRFYFWFYISLLVCIIFYYKFNLNKNLKNISFIMYISFG